MPQDNNTDTAIHKPLDEELQGQIYFDQNKVQSKAKSFYVESYGCAMNFADSEVVASILSKEGYTPTKELDNADLVFINTCSIREKAEETIKRRVFIFNKQKRKNPNLVIGILGCMAERLKSKWLDEDKLIDLVVGPDAYRDLPSLISNVQHGHKGINVLLSREETYADIEPLRLDNNSISAYISIMRGCDNMCSFCVVPFTRGRERSRNPYTIVAEAQDVFDRGYKEVLLLGQNVDSFKWQNPEDKTNTSFAQLLEMVARIHPTLRIRFSTSHPKDITDDVLYTIAKYKNICKHIHLPVQSGNSRILSLMKRTYDRPWFEERVNKIKEIIPNCSISSDIITGFCTETEEDHQDTLDVIKWANFSTSFMYFYSERPGTLAARKYEDDVPLETKKRRLAEVIKVQHAISLATNESNIGKVFEVLIDGDSKRSDQEFIGRTTQNIKVIFPKKEHINKGDYVHVKITSANSQTQRGIIVE